MKKLLLFALCMFALAYAAVTQTTAPKTQTYEIDALNAKILKPGDRVDVMRLLKINDITYARTVAQNAAVEDISGGSVRLEFDGDSKFSPGEGAVLKTKITLRNPGDKGLSRDNKDVNLADLFR